MLICRDCKREVDEYEVVQGRECVGEAWGAPAYQDYYACPYCGGDELVEIDEDCEE